MCEKIAISCLKGSNNWVKMLKFKIVLSPHICTVIEARRRQCREYQNIFQFALLGKLCDLLNLSVLRSSAIANLNEKSYSEESKF